VNSKKRRVVTEIQMASVVVNSKKRRVVAEIQMACVVVNLKMRCGIQMTSVVVNSNPKGTWRVEGRAGEVMGDVMGVVDAMSRVWWLR
jgi:hypothetical protein